MSHTCRIATLFAALVIAAAVSAGDLVQSNSKRPGLFFAWLSGEPVRVYFPDRTNLRSLALHCNSGKDVFSLRTGARAKCKVVVPGSEAAFKDWEEGETTVQLSTQEPDSPGFGVFSLTPPRTIGWAIRQTTLEEADALKKLLASDKQKFTELARELKLD